MQGFVLHPVCLIIYNILLYKVLKVQAVEYTQPFQHLLAKKETSSDILGSICTKLNDILTKTIEC